MGWFGWVRRRRTAKDSGASSGSVDAVMYGRERTRGIPYVMPTDLEEMNRLDLQHYMLGYALHGNYAAPISHPRSILDVGTGTGRWVREMAQTFPQADVIGVDVNLPPADALAKEGKEDVRPPNYTFVQANLLTRRTSRAWAASRRQ